MPQLCEMCEVCEMLVVEDKPPACPFQWGEESIFSLIFFTEPKPALRNNSKWSGRWCSGREQGFRERIKSTDFFSMQREY